MKFYIGTSSRDRQLQPGVEVVPPTGLPADHPPIPSASASASASVPGRLPAECPMSSSAQAQAQSSRSSFFASGSGSGSGSSSRSGPAKCPVQHDSSSSSSSSNTNTNTMSKGGDSLNPLNMIPANLSLAKQPGQTLDLPVERTESSIPRPQSPDSPGGEAYGTGSNWDYPSPQQFYNALVRKGWETPEDSVEVMVAIHNFLNERAWDEVMKWEKRLPGGERSQLARFEGKPGQLSPKARMHLWAAKVFPERFNTTPPFDRHDWIVTRPSTSSPSSSTTASSASASAPAPPTTTTRYVIDYYSAPPDEDGNPVFHLDVRPALDSFESISQRIKVGLEEWRRGDAE